MPIVAGVFEILAGLWISLSASVLIQILLLFGSARDLSDWLGGILFVIPGPLGIVAVVGGVFALIRRKWRLAFAGAIATVPLFLVAHFGLHWFEGYQYFKPSPPILYLNFVSLFLLSIIIIVLLLLSKKEFK